MKGKSKVLPGGEYEENAQITTKWVKVKVSIGEGGVDDKVG